MVSPPPRQYHHGRLREAVIEAALAEIEAVGPAALSIREIARRAGVSHAAPAHHFGDKAGIFTAIATEGYRQLGHVTREATLGENALVSGAMAYVRFALTHRAYFEVMFRPDLYRADDTELRAAGMPPSTSCSAPSSRRWAPTMLRRCSPRRSPPGRRHTGSPCCGSTATSRTASPTTRRPRLPLPGQESSVSGTSPVGSYQEPSRRFEAKPARPPRLAAPGWQAVAVSRGRRVGHLLRRGVVDLDARRELWHRRHAEGRGCGHGRQRRAANQHDGGEHDHDHRGTDHRGANDTSATGRVRDGLQPLRDGRRRDAVPPGAGRGADRVPRVEPRWGPAARPAPTAAAPPRSRRGPWHRVPHGGRRRGRPGRRDPRPGDGHGHAPGATSCTATTRTTTW